VNSAHKRLQARKQRQSRVRRKIRGTAEQPRLCIFRSARHIYAQLIIDENGTTIASASTLDDLGLDNCGNVSAAKAVGAKIAERALAKNIEQVVFDRNGFLYHGRVRALADAARESGLKF